MIDIKNNFKIVFDGNTFVGKTSLLKRFIYDIFSDKTDTLYVQESFFKAIEINDKAFNIQFLDLLGAKRYDHQREQFYMDANCLIIIIDLTDIFHKDSLTKRINIADKCGIKRKTVILGGNKADLDEDMRLDYKDLMLFLEEFNINYYIETSVKKDINVKQLIHLATAVCAHDQGIFNDVEFKRILDEIKSQIIEFRFDSNEYQFNFSFEELMNQNDEFMIDCPYCLNKINKFQITCQFCKSNLK